MSARADGSSRTGRIVATVAQHVGPGARILDVGCGAGDVSQALRAQGFDVLGVDPRAPREPGFLAVAVEDLVEPGGFDVACAVMSLHHGDLDAMCRSIHALVRPGGLFFVWDFSWVDYDTRAHAWVGRYDRSSDVDHPSDGPHEVRDNSVAGWATEHAGLHDRGAMGEALERWFLIEEARSATYLAWMLERPDLEPEEQAWIDRGELPGLGVEWRCRR